MRLEAIVVCVAMAVLPAGCVVITRVTVAPTVDTLGNLGADVRVSLIPAIGRRDDAGVWLGSDFGLSGSYLGTERVGAAQVRVGPEAGDQPNLIFPIQPCLYAGLLEFRQRGRSRIMARRRS